MGEGARRPEARCHPDWAGVDAAGRWSESHASYPGRAAALLAGELRELITLQGVMTEPQQSAEAVVAKCALW